MLRDWAGLNQRHVSSGHYNNITWRFDESFAIDME
jgi:hypothetical protein